jgi:hypothetical protein
MKIPGRRRKTVLSIFYTFILLVTEALDPGFVDKGLSEYQSQTLSLTETVALWDNPTRFGFFLGDGTVN